MVELLRERGAGDKLVVAGGVIPEEDATLLLESGIQRIFTMGTETGEIISFIEQWVANELYRNVGISI